MVEHPKYLRENDEFAEILSFRYSLSSWSFSWSWFLFAPGGEMTCLTLNSLGFQMCTEENGGAWRILDCGASDTEARTYPFGWYEKPGEWPIPNSCVGVFSWHFLTMYEDDVLGLGSRLAGNYWVHMAETDSVQCTQKRNLLEVCWWTQRKDDRWVSATWMHSAGGMDTSPSSGFGG